MAARLASLLATIDSATPSFTMFELSDGVRLLGPPVAGVAALLVIAGTMHLEDGAGGTIAVGPGSLALLPSDVRAAIVADAGHATVTLDGRQCLIQRDGWLVADATRGRPATLIVAAARIAGSTADALSGPMVTPVSGSDVGKPLVALLKAECARGAAGHPALAMSLMTACVVQGLRQAMAAAPDTEQAVHGATGNLVARAIAAIRGRPAEPHSVDSLAAVAGMSRSTFIRHFRRVMRMSPLEYVQRVRLDEAKAILGSTDLPIKTVAANTGFASRSHFSRLFRAAYGSDPSTYRQQPPGDEAAA
ncbi:MAG TPA: AraC family transcriptional regulator [Sphingomonas sp.]